MTPFPTLLWLLPRCPLTLTLIDGGFYSNLPYDIAINEGCKDIVALHIVGGRSFDDEVYNMYGVLAQAIGILLEARIKEEEYVVKRERANVLYIPLEPPFEASIFDFSKTRELIEMGYEQARRVLKGKSEGGIVERFKRFLKKIANLKNISVAK